MGGVDDLEMEIDAKNVNKDDMIDVPDAKETDADMAAADVADLGLAEADVTDLDVPTEELHSTSCDITRYTYRLRKKFGRSAPIRRLSKTISNSSI